METTRFNEPIYKDQGPEPTLGKRSNYRVKSITEQVIYAVVSVVLGGLLLILIEQAKTTGIDINTKYIPAEEWVGSVEYKMLVVIVCAFAAVAFVILLGIMRRVNCRRNAITGVIVGFRRSGKSVSGTDHMDLVVDAKVNGNQEYVRVCTFDGKGTKLYYSVGSTVDFYKYGNKFYVV